MATLQSSHVPLRVHTISSRSSASRGHLATSGRIAFSPGRQHLSARRITVTSRLAEPPSVRRDTGNGAVKSSVVIDRDTVEDDIARAIAARAAPTVALVEASVLVQTPPPENVEPPSTSDTPWFQAARDSKVQVSVAPGGRWNKFKTYSTFQRTLQIWSFVIKFIVKVGYPTPSTLRLASWSLIQLSTTLTLQAWLSGRKFSYRGGMTVEKQKLRRRQLAKYLKENLLRLGPTFIKAGQQFSTRVSAITSPSPLPSPSPSCFCFPSDTRGQCAE